MMSSSEVDRRNQEMTLSDLPIPQGRVLSVMGIFRCAVKRRWSTAGGKTRPGTGSLHPVTIGAAVEATKPPEPPV